MSATLTIARNDLHQVRPGDKLIGIDGRGGLNHTITGPLVHLGDSKTPAIPFVNDSNGIAGNLYPDSIIENEITVERPTKRTAPSQARPERKSATHINVGDRIIVEPTADGLRATTRKTGVIVAKVTGKRSGGGFRCYTLTTTAGELITPAAGKFTMAPKSEECTN